jgi:5'-3' exonuclease
VLYLLDAHVYIFRAYYSLPEMLAPDGSATHAAYGFANTLLRMVSELDVDEMVCCFDYSMTSFRNEIEASYKAERGEVPEDLDPQFAICQEVAETFGFANYAVPEFEADDVIATLCHRWGDSCEIAVTSVDKDLAQLVREDGAVVLYDFAKDNTLDATGVRDKFGVSPHQIPDYLGLVGDSVDNLPGVPGIGPKGAAAVLASWDRLEDAPSDPEAWATLPVRGGRRLCERFSEHRDRALRTKCLATLRRDVPGLPKQPDVAKRTRPKLAALAGLCRRLGWGTIEERAANILGAR